MYKHKGFGACAICKKCRQDVVESGQEPLSFPVGAFFVGEKFEIHKNKIRLLVVGKVARGEYDSQYGGGLKCGRDLWNGKGEYNNSKSWAFWAYTREIVQILFGDESAENIAMTNIIQCNNSSDIDITTDSTKKHCIVELGAIKEEIKIIKPNIIIFYTIVNYGSHIPYAFDTFSEKVTTKKKIGQKYMVWQEAVGMIDGSTINVLNIGHPERMKKIEYTSAVAEWVKVMSG